MISLKWHFSYGKREEGFPITGKHYINLIAYFDLVSGTNIQWPAC